MILNYTWDCEGLQKAVALECSSILHKQKRDSKKTGRLYYL